MKNMYICQDVSFKCIEWKVKSILKEDRYSAGRDITHLCISCKNIWDDKDYWNHIEAHIREHPQAEFTHYTCPECAKKFIWNLFNK